MNKTFRGLGALFLILCFTFLAQARERDPCDRVLGARDINHQLKLEKHLAKTAADFFLANFRLPTQDELSKHIALDEIKGSADLVETTRLLLLIQDLYPQKLEKMRTRVIRAYTGVARQTGRTPTLSELASRLETTEQNLEQVTGILFQGMEGVKKLAKKRHPSVFYYVIDTDIFNEKRANDLLNAIKKRKRLVLTTAVSGSPVNKDFFAALLKYCEKVDAEIIVFPANMQTDEIDPVLLNTPRVHVLTHTYELGNSLAFNKIKILAKQINPLMGLDRIGKRGQTQIVGSPKMHLKTIPTIDNDLGAHMLISTGAITDPLYEAKKYISRRTDEIAYPDHVMGALVVEKDSGYDNFSGLRTTGDFHLRHIEFVPEKKGFTDLGRFFSGERTVNARPLALVLGDIHVGVTDQRLLQAVKDQILEFKPRYIILHDSLDGHSVSHHDRNKLILTAAKAQSGKLDLREELQKLASFTNAICALDRQVQIVFVPSNHPFWLHRWLEEFRFRDDPHNMEIGLELALAKLRGEDPLEYGVTNNGLEYPKRVTFLKRGESFKVGPENRLVELGQHGHAGANGAKPSFPTLQRGVDRAVIGHTHSSTRPNGIVGVGTSTLLRLGYNDEGFSSWVQSLALVGENGEIQALQFKNGEWYSDPRGKGLSPDRFFMPGFPFMIPNKMSIDEVGQFDQYR